MSEHQIFLAMKRLSALGSALGKEL